jgi:hypothetical protein
MIGQLRINVSSVADIVSGGSGCLCEADGYKYNVVIGFKRTGSDPRLIRFPALYENGRPEAP